jgi:hypothetical protein
VPGANGRAASAEKADHIGLLPLPTSCRQRDGARRGLGVIIGVKRVEGIALKRFHFVRVVDSHRRDSTVRTLPDSGSDTNRHPHREEAAAASATHAVCQRRLGLILSGPPCLDAGRLRGGQATQVGTDPPCPDARAAVSVDSESASIAATASAIA